MVVNNHILFYIVPFHPKYPLSAIIDAEARYLSEMLAVDRRGTKGTDFFEDLM